MYSFGKFIFELGNIFLFWEKYFILTLVGYCKKGTGNADSHFEAHSFSEASVVRLNLKEVGGVGTGVKA